MKIRHSKTSVTFHTDWITLIAYIAITVWAWISCFRLETRPAWLPNVDWWIVGTIGIVITIVATRSCRFTREDISIRYLGIPVKKISWDRVAQLVIAPYDEEIRTRKDLVIVMDNGPAFTEEDFARKFNQSNKHSSYLIALPGKKISETAEALNNLIPVHVAPIAVENE